MRAPAMLQRRPAKIPGETVVMPIFIASQVVPQTKQMKTNIARCDGVAEPFIERSARVLLLNRIGSASGRVGAAPNRNGAYASGRVWCRATDFVEETG
jgi:hypothetical protein